MPSLLRPAALVAGRRVAPVLIAADVIRVAGRHWRENLTDAERGRLIALIKESHGRPGNLSARDRKDLDKLVRKLNVAALARAVATSVVLAKGSKGRRKKR